MVARGNVSDATSGWKCVEVACTVFGGPSSSAQKAGSRMWQPMSPSGPVPKSTQARHFVGWYSG